MPILDNKISKEADLFTNFKSEYLSNSMLKAKDELCTRFHGYIKLAYLTVKIILVL
jgi:hypothetical protein